MDWNKEKCRTLKQIRKKMADAMDIDLHQTECTYEGKCSGTCPKCRQEEQLLNRALLGKTVLAASVVGMSVSLAGCTPNGMQVEGGMDEPVEVEYTDYLEGDIETDSEEVENSETRNSENLNSTDETGISTENSTENSEDTEERYELEGDIAYTEGD